MNITFIGAAQTVTGSCTMVECGEKKFLIDCGLPQGNDAKNIGFDLPFPAADIDFVLLTHAHIDHSGRLPLLVKEGFRGRILATDATADLCSIMLADSGHIQEMEAKWQNRKRKRAGQPAIDPLYTVEDAKNAVDLFEGFPYYQRIEVAEGIEAEFIDAGHLLGSSSIQLWLTEGIETRHLVFSGDVGNLDQPLINDPSCLSEADFVIVESTYGDRLHPQPEHATQKVSTEERSRELADIIRETFSRGGNVIIPSFAVGRTQELLYLLRVITTHNLLPEIPQIPVFLDSPLAIEATKVYSRNISGYFDEEAMDLVRKGINPLTFPSLTVTVTADESRKLNARKESAVIISASGMCEAGRIKHHLKHNLWRRESSIVFCGYQAVGTLGRSILDGDERVSVFGEKITVRAEIRKLAGISGHADREGLMHWLSCFSNRPEQIFVVHGEERVAKWFAAHVSSKLGIPAWAPASEESFDLLKDKLPAASALEAEEAVTGAEELDTAYAKLEAVMGELEAVADRFHRHKLRLRTDHDAQPAVKLASAVSRFSAELQELLASWNGGGGGNEKK
jgi:metallo-beta-lactamase family protein